MKLTDEEIKYLRLITHAQTYLVRQEAELVEALLFEEQDDLRVHHVRPGQRTCRPVITLGLGSDYSVEYATAEIVPFPKRGAP